MVELEIPSRISYDHSQGTSLECSACHVPDKASAATTAGPVLERKVGPGASDLYLRTLKAQLKRYEER